MFHWMEKSIEVLFNRIGIDLLWTTTNLQNQNKYKGPVQLRPRFQMLDLFLNLGAKL